MAFVKTIVIVFQFLIFSIFYFRRWIYDHVNTGIIGLYVHVHSNGTRTFPRDVKVPSMYYVGTFLDPHPPTLCKQNVVSMQNKPFFDPPCFLQVTILELWRLCVPHLAQTSFLQKVFCRVGTVSSKIMTFVHTFKVNFLCQKTSESFLFFCCFTLFSKMMPIFWWHCAISQLQISKKHFATFDRLVKMTLVPNVVHIN